MNKLPLQKQAQIIASLVEGASINGTCRITGVAKNTVLKLIKDLGEACAIYQDKTLRHLDCKRIQADEIWNFCYSKEKNVPKNKKGRFGYGDVWTWVAIDPDTKLVPAWFVGGRDAASAKAFMDDLSERLANRVQLTTDGFGAYLGAVEGAFGSSIDYSQLIKVYGEAKGEGKYSPGECCGAYPERVTGNPDPEHVSTSLIERQNLTMRMCMRRFTRLTNAHSKKIQNLMYSIAIHYMYYNFVRINQAIRCTPAMKAKVSDHVWSLEEVLGLLGVESSN